MRENRHRSQENFYSSDRNHETSPAISEMAKKEQEHRHKWQDKYLESNSISTRIGQITGFAYNIALLYLIYDLIRSGEKTLAFQLFVLNIALIAFALLITVAERRIPTRKPGRKNFGNRNRNDRHRDDRRPGRDNNRR